MKILAIEKPVSGTAHDRFTPEILSAEARASWDLHCRGVIRELYFTADTHEAVLVLECDSPGTAKRQLSELPLVRAGLIDFQLLPLAPYTGFERLFHPPQVGSHD